MNLLTYVSLYRYGYEDVYELSEATSVSDDRLRWIDRDLQLAANTDVVLTVQ